MGWIAFGQAADIEVVPHASVHHSTILVLCSSRDFFLLRFQCSSKFSVTKDVYSLTFSIFVGIQMNKIVIRLEHSMYFSAVNLPFSESMEGSD